MTEPARSPERVATEFVDAFNHGDWDRLRDQLVGDVRYSETGTGRQVEGADAYVQLCQGWKDAFPDGRGVIGRAITGEDTVVLELRWEGTHTGPMETAAGTIPATAKPMSVDASFWARTREDRIEEVHHHLDVLTMMQQIGVLPDAGTS